MKAVISVYDQLNGVDRDYDYWRGLARTVAPRDLCDLGCGTGIDMRNPHARGWEAWNPTDSRRRVTTTEVLSSGVRAVVSDTLCFRDEPALRESLVQAGFEVVHVHGDWDGSPATQASRELIVTARRGR
ncbi:MAG: hypothetical protein ACXVET_02810 [Nocardioidaceae bacterium]